MQRAAVDGTSYGAPTEREVVLAEEICARVPSCQMVRLVSSGTEATMSAIRVARGFTGRPAVVKFAGNYHGHGDLLLAEAGSGLAALGLPGSAGVTEAAVHDTVVVPYNQVPSSTSARPASSSSRSPPTWAWSPPTRGSSTGLRAECDRVGALLIFDEVITGFRVARGGAQELFGVAPDLTTMGKVIGGGLNIGAYGGRADVMGVVAPLGPRLPGGHAVGEPAGHRGRAGRARPARRGRLRHAARPRPRRWPASCARPLAAPASWPTCRWRRRWWGCTSATRCPPTTTAPAPPTRPATPGCSTPCSTGAWRWRPGAYEVMFPGLAHTDEVLAEVEIAVTEAAAEAARQRLSRGPVPEATASTCLARAATRRASPRGSPVAPSAGPRMGSSVHAQAPDSRWGGSSMYSMRQRMSLTSQPERDRRGEVAAARSCPGRRP